MSDLEPVDDPRPAQDPWRERLSEYLDGDLAPDERRACELHVAGCGACRALLADFARLTEAAREVGHAEPGRDLWPAIEARIGAAPRILGLEISWRLAVAVAAVAALFFALGRTLTGGAVGRPAPGGGERYALLLHEPPEMLAESTPQEIARVVDEYRAWSREVGRGGHMESGEKLADREGFFLRREGAVERGSVEGLGGFFLVRAASYEEALAIARTCPHLKYGGWIEVRRIEET